MRTSRCARQRASFTAMKELDNVGNAGKFHTNCLLSFQAARETAIEHISYHSAPAGRDSLATFIVSPHAQNTLSGMRKNAREVRATGRLTPVMDNVDQTYTINDSDVLAFMQALSSLTGSLQCKLGCKPKEKKQAAELSEISCATGHGLRHT